MKTVKIVYRIKGKNFEEYYPDLYSNEKIKYYLPLFTLEYYKSIASKSLIKMKFSDSNVIIRGYKYKLVEFCGNANHLSDFLVDNKFSHSESDYNSIIWMPNIWKKVLKLKTKYDRDLKYTYYFKTKCSNDIKKSHQKCKTVDKNWKNHTILHRCDLYL